MGESVKLGLCMGFRVTKSDGVRETAWYARSSRENDWIGEKKEKKRETRVFDHAVGCSPIMTAASFSAPPFITA